MTTATLKIATLLIGISALLHLALAGMNDFSAESLRLLPFGIVYIFLAALVWVNKRWAAWLAFFLMLFDGIAAMAGYLNPGVLAGAGAMTQEFYLGMWVADWLAALCLFVSLWGDKAQARPKPVRSTERRAPEV